MRCGTVVFSFALGLMLSPLLAVESIVVLPIDAQAVTEDGAIWTIDPASDTLNTARFSFGRERRGVLEFPLDALPQGAIITSVDITLDLAGFTSTETEFPVIEFRGYAGDGLLAISDATVKAPVVGVSDPLDGTPTVVALDAAFLQFLIGSASHLGLYTIQQTLGRQVDFYSAEFAEIFSVTPAQLTIEFDAPIENGGLLQVTDRRDLVWDQTRKRLYITTTGGTIERFDANTRTLLSPFDLGVPLNGADMTSDGAFLYVASGADGLADASIRKVDLDSGSVTTLTFSRAFAESDRWDIKIGANGVGLITSRFGGSGWVPVRTIDLATDQITERTDVPGSNLHNVRGGTKLSRSYDRSTIFLGEPGGTLPDLILYNAADDSFPLSVEASIGSYGVDSASPDGGLLARSHLSTIGIRNRVLEVVDEIGNSNPGNRASGGSVFHPGLPILYVADEDSNQIIAFAIPGFDELYRISIGESVSVALAFDNGTMAMNDTGLLLFLSTPSGARVYDVPHPGTEDCDGNGIRDICDLDCEATDLVSGLPCSKGGTCGTAADCTGNGTPDQCEPDCNTNLIPDSCETSSGQTPDCNYNRVPDSCETDCNFNLSPDDCDVASGASDDCDRDGVPDECQEDCDLNGLTDACEILTDPSLDQDGDGFIDACSCATVGEQIVTGVTSGRQDQFGFSVAMAGSLAVVGSYGDDVVGPPLLPQAGAAYVYGEVNGVWGERFRLTAADAASGDLFGYAVGVQGDTVFVGAPADANLGQLAGAVYVFQTNGETSSQVQELRPTDAAAFDVFGISLAVSGDWLWVGARNEGNSGNPDAPFDGGGAVYAFRRESGTWVERAKLTVAESTAADFFGESVALDGDFGAIGAWGRDDACQDDGNCNSGAVYVFRLTGGTTWVEATKIVASDGAAGDNFGASVAVASPDILVGATRADLPGTPDTGAGYFYTFDGVDAALFVGKLEVPFSESFDNFGTVVALDGDVIVLGGSGADGAAGGSGAAALFARHAGVWRYQSSTASSDGRFADRFAAAAAIDGDRGLFGAPIRPGNPSDPGAAYFFDGLASCLPPAFQIADLADLVDCIGGPRAHPSPTNAELDVATCLRNFDREGDRDVDLDDVARLLRSLEP
jgi:FG-GAP repeat